MLRIDHRGTGLVLDYLHTLGSGRRPSREAIREIAFDPGYVFLLERTRAIIRQFGGKDSDAEGLTTEELERCLDDYSEGRAWEGHRFFSRFVTALEQARQDLPRHCEVYEAVGRLQPGTLEQEVLNRLPTGASIDSTAYFLAETHTDAYAFKRDVVISFWPLKLAGGRPVCTGMPVENVLKHELHHIGLASVLPEPYSSDRTPSTPGELALALVGAVSGEGSATMFFTPYDAPMADPKRWEKTVQDLPMHYRDLENGLCDLIGGRLEVSEGMKTLPARFLGAYEGRHLPAIYILGVDMCRRIAAERGEEGLVELLRSPARFLQAYSEIAARGDNYRFSADVIQAIQAAEDAAMAST